MATAEQAPQPAKRRRPLAVTILALIQLANTLLLVVLAAGLILAPEQATDELAELIGSAGSLDIDAETRVIFVGVVFGAVGLLQLVSAIALLRLKRIGWTLAMLLAGISLASQIATWWTTGSLVPISALLYVFTVLYLNQGPVRMAFGLAAPGEQLEKDRG